MVRVNECSYMVAAGCKWTKGNAMNVGIKILKLNYKNGFILIWKYPCYYICADPETDT
jgi:hypothetical protein